MVPVQARGVVYEDGPEQRGIPGVLVSNQQQVAVTDERGYFSLPVGPGQFIVVTKPAGYRLPENEFGQPLNHYLYQPEGSPASQNLIYPGIAPTGTMPPILRFPLQRHPESDQFQAIFMGDIQPDTEREIGYFHDLAVPTLRDTPADFVVPLGDLTWDNLSLYPKLQPSLRDMHKPFYPVCGNHDINLRATDVRYSRETFKRHFGPTYYSFDYGQVHFVILDDIGYSGWNSAEAVKGGAVGWLDDRQLEWLANDLSFVPDDKLVVLCMHIPIYTNIAPERDYRNLLNRERLFSVLHNRRHLLAVSAHTHWVEQLDLQDGGWSGQAEFPALIAGAACGAWWQGPPDQDGYPVRMGMDGAPNGFFRLSFDGNRYAMAFCPIDGQECRQMAIHLQDDPPRPKIVANVYRASPFAEVTCRINGGSPIAMNRQVREDPYVLRFLKEHREAYAPWMMARKTAHLWETPLPSEWSRQELVVEVAARERNGEQWREVINVT